MQLAAGKIMCNRHPHTSPPHTPLHPIRLWRSQRRRRQRKHSIPWDKIRVEEMGPVSFCGQQVPQQQWARRSGGKVAAAAVQGRGGGKCPFGFTAGEQGSVPAGKKVN